MKVCIVQPNRQALSETFLRAQAECLPAETMVLHGKRPARDVAAWSDHAGHVRVRAQRWLAAKPKSWEFTQHCLRHFRLWSPDVVVAQFGTTGVRVKDACREARIPLVVNFRGYDASMQCVVDEHRGGYDELFDQAAAIVAVSRGIRDQLMHWGAPAEKVYWNPSGADCLRFQGGTPNAAAAVFVAAGRFVDKKAPHLTILAFAEVHRRLPTARLRMIGDGPLFGFCRELTRRLDLEDAVTLLGARSHADVASEMRQARAFVQHSLTARSGDSEGTPVAVMEAGASGLPVVATRHAGIPDVVLDGQTGLLVDERDVHAMAERMLRLAEDPELAQRLGAAARERVRRYFSQQRSLRRFWSILNMAVHDGRVGNGIDLDIEGWDRRAA